MGLRGPRPTYDWAGWFHLGKFRATRGTHYRCSTRSFVQQARNAAARIGVSLRVLKRKDSVDMFVTSKEDGDAEGK